MGGETSRRLELLPRKKGKVRVRVVDESMKTRNIFCLTTKDSRITDENEFASFKSENSNFISIDYKC